jgi:hypothetical protein
MRVFEGFAGLLTKYMLLGYLDTHVVHAAAAVAV